MKVKRINNSSESITSSEILKGLQGTNYMICPKLPIQDVLDENVLNDLSKAHKNLYNESHFDFVVTTSDYIPVFAVEFDGPHHYLYEKKRIRDIRKNRLCQEAKLPLIRVTDEHIEQYDAVSVVQFMAYRFSLWQSTFESVKEEIENEISKMTEEEFKYYYAGGFIRPEIDPHFRFDMKYPFPKSIEIQNTLTDKYNIGLFSPKDDNRDSMWCVVMPGGEGSIDGLFYHEADYGIYKGFRKSLCWSGGHISNSDIKVLIEGRVKFSLRWALITSEDYNYTESPIEYEKRTGVMPIYHGDVPGAFMPSIIQAMSEYLGYKMIFNWIQQHYESA